MSNVIDIDTCRSNQEIMDIEVRFEQRDRQNVIRKRIPQTSTPPKKRLRSDNDFARYANSLWRSGDEPGDLGFQDGTEYD